jgi:4-oxalocrotonate tautomerase
MPYLHLTLGHNPGAERMDQAAQALTNLTVELLGKRRELTALTIAATPEGQWFVGGAPLAGQSYQLDIKVTEGTNTADEKARYIAQVHATLEALLGPMAAASYVVIHEVDGRAWGYQGHTQATRRQALPQGAL